jgi:hypothetical protein
MKRAGPGEEETMQITGHKTAAMFRRYDIVDERDVVGAGRKLEAHQVAMEICGSRRPEQISKVRTKFARQMA